MKLTRERLEREIRIWSRRRDAEGIIASSFVLDVMRLALLGLERDERAERMKADAAELDRVREEWDKKDTEETVELRARAAELEAEVDRLRAERDSRPEITPEDAALLRDWMLSERAEACAEHPTPHWVGRVVDATCAHARKVKP